MIAVHRLGVARISSASANLRRNHTWSQCFDAIQSRNPTYNALISVQSRSALEQSAAASDKRYQQGKPLSPLDGTPVVVKDNFCTTALPTTCASNMLKDFTSPYDARVVQLLTDAGAIMMGKSNMDEFGMGSANIYSEFGPVFNPLDGPKQPTLDNHRVAGGSSGGSAAAVALGMCKIALGSDTGGSVRLPASYCGVVGFKPSYGRCSRNGLVAYANSLDTVGILSQTVDDAQTAYDVIAQYDENDPTSMPVPLREAVDGQDRALAEKWSSDDLSELVVGIPAEYYVDPLSLEVKEAWRRGIQCLKERGASIVSVSLPHTRFALPAYYIIALAEASSNLARFDGIRYGHRSGDKNSADDLLYADTRSEGFGPEVQRRILLGTHVLTAGTYEKHFLPAQQTRRLIQRDFDDVFLSPNPLYSSKEAAAESMGTKAHVLLTPCGISSAPTIEESRHSSRPVDAFVNDVMTVPASLAGLPAIAIPFAKSSDSGYPIGLQLLSQYGHDRSLLRIARVLSECK
ncbi:amidase signature enzyme [Radiomyces spectabilis]|uniref:amidase signature enzyme n=1 Tax=Radiomyces spectabilis TaxID=64574 RepID=UPI0022204AE8|nr:amidase signature enzyme [Radiomyces spectabilis]KAI8372888.1 amidase signature enzyme [Radiomyces spectabilis]